MPADADQFIKFVDTKSIAQYIPVDQLSTAMGGTVSEKKRNNNMKNKIKHGFPSCLSVIAFFSLLIRQPIKSMTNLLSLHIYKTTHLTR